MFLIFIHACNCFDMNLYYDICLQELLTRHKSTVSEFLSKNYDWVSDFLMVCKWVHAQTGPEAFLMYTSEKAYQC